MIRILRKIAGPRAIFNTRRRTAFEMKRKIALVLCAAMLIAALGASLTGCGGDAGESSSPPGAGASPSAGDGQATGDASADPEDGGSGDPGAALAPGAAGDSAGETGIDFDGAFAALAPDTVMLYAGDMTVTWAELFMFLYGNINEIIYSAGSPLPWNEVLYADVTFEDALLDYSIENALFYKTIEYGVGVAGVTLSEDDKARMQQDYEDALEMYGGEEEFLKLLWEKNGCNSREHFEYLVSMGILANRLFTETYGDMGELLSDEDLDEYTKNDGYMKAKHILRMKTEEGGDDGGNDALAETEEILSLLEAYDGDDFDAFFDELMLEYTEDDLSYFPNGYLFQFGDMVESFTIACYELEPWQISGIVESEYGYHIIYRLPIDYDEIPFANFLQGDYTSLRRVAAIGMFDSMMYGWADSLDIEHTGALEALDLAAIFQQS